MFRRFFLQQTTLWTGVATVMVGAAISAAGAGQVQAQEEIEELTFGIISTESQANQKPIWDPFIEAMSESLGIPVTARYATQYSGIIEAMRFDEVDIAWFGGKSYIEAAERSGAEAFALTVAEDGSKGYFAHLITNKDNPILEEIDLEALNGDEYIIENGSELSFAFNDPNSTSGFLVPSYYVFAQNSADPEDVFDRVIFAGSHEATALAVANNQVDVATNNNESLQRLETTNPEAREKIEIIWTSPQIPSDPIALRDDLPEELKEEIRNFFYTYDDEEVLGPLQWAGFEEADDSRWNTIRELEIAKQKLEVQNNDSLSEEEKSAQIAELDAQLEALQE